jgi:hypothetical protein
MVELVFSRRARMQRRYHSSTYAMFTVERFFAGTTPPAADTVNKLGYWNNKSGDLVIGSVRSVFNEHEPEASNDVSCIDSPRSNARREPPRLLH